MLELSFDVHNVFMTFCLNKDFCVNYKKIVIHACVIKLLKQTLCYKIQKNIINKSMQRM